MPSHVSNNSSIQNDMKHGGALSPLLFTFALGRINDEIKEGRRGINRRY
jgi:hypothetical protein